MDAASRYRRLSVRAVVDETADAKSIVFDVPEAEAAAFKYRPGQFITLRLPVAGRHLPRCYSMSSAPAVDDAPRVTVKRVEGGRGSNWVCDHLKPGDVIEVLPPAGVFTPRSLDGDFLLLAGGSGITPVLSILRSALAQGSGRITLIYANRDERSVIFKRELTALAGAHPQRLLVIHWLDSVQGVPSVAQLAELATPFRKGQAFICGPGPFMDASVAALQGIEMDAEHIHVERFASLPDEEDTAAAAAASEAAPAAAAAVDEAQVEVRIGGTTHHIVCGGNETLLEAALRQGIDAPYSCQAGMCASCMCQMVSGEVHMRTNDVLDKKDLAKGWVLACQAVPLTPQIAVKYPQ
ncbi:MAG TPA: ferredoxin--NADP reductase [Rubrivivax sp.]|nr:ferredoxin--NADP reductase [Rubrivivax sp.]HPO20713.1 ferredoxin--NADP reductase [Rubrivivax sp.]